MGRQLVYDPSSCDLCIVGSSSNVYRLNLEQGRFLRPFDITAPAASVPFDSLSPNDFQQTCAFNVTHSLLAVGTEDGTIEFFDQRALERVAVVRVAATADLLPERESVLEAQVTALTFDSDDLTLAAGTSTGVTLLYDLRQQHALFAKDQQVLELDQLLYARFIRTLAHLMADLCALCVR
jgi:ribosome biogenesis protein ENP2